MKAQSHVRSYRPVESRFIAKSRLDLNDLKKRRQLEKKIDQKNNLIIFSGATTIAAAVFVILIL